MLVSNLFIIQLLRSLVGQEWDKTLIQLDQVQKEEVGQLLQTLHPVRSVTFKANQESSDVKNNALQLLNRMLGQDFNPEISKFEVLLTL